MCAHAVTVFAANSVGTKNVPTLHSRSTKNVNQFAGYVANDFMTLPLSDLNIVITRPREQAGGLVQRIEQMGGKPLLFPLLEISAVHDESALLQQLSRLQQTDLAIFIKIGRASCRERVSTIV